MQYARADFDAKLTKIYAKSRKSTECVQIASIFPHLPTKRPAEGFRGFKLQKLIIRKFFVIIRKKVHVRVAYVKNYLYLCAKFCYKKDEKNFPFCYADAGTAIRHEWM